MKLANSIFLVARALTEICEYTVNSKMHLIAFFDFVSHTIYPWHLTWLDTAIERWGSNFLGVYLYDEPCGRQIDCGQWDEGEWNARMFIDLSDYMRVRERGSRNRTKN